MMSQIYVQPTLFAPSANRDAPVVRVWPVVFAWLVALASVGLLLVATPAHAGMCGGGRGRRGRLG